MGGAAGQLRNPPKQRGVLADLLRRLHDRQVLFLHLAPPPTSTSPITASKSTWKTTEPTRRAILCPIRIFSSFSTKSTRTSVFKNICCHAWRILLLTVFSVSRAWLIPVGFSPPLNFLDMTLWLMKILGFGLLRLILTLIWDCPINSSKKVKFFYFSSPQNATRYDSNCRESSLSNQTETGRCEFWINSFILLFSEIAIRKKQIVSFQKTWGFYWGGQHCSTAQSWGNCQRISFQEQFDWNI